MKYIIDFKLFESVNTYSKWVDNSGNVVKVLGTGDKLISYISDKEPTIKKEDTIINFLKIYTEVKKEEASNTLKEKQIYDGGFTGDVFELDFDKYLYLPDEKAVVGSYFITHQDDNFISLLNIKEFASETSSFWDEATPYSVSFHNITLPKSKIDVLFPVNGKEGFFYIKMPYWIFKENDGLSIKRVKGTYKNTKRLDLRDASLNDKDLMKNFGDINVEKYFKISNPDERVQQLVRNYKNKAKL